MRRPKDYLIILAWGQLTRPQRASLLAGCLQTVDSVRTSPDGTEAVVKWIRPVGRPGQLIGRGGALTAEQARAYCDAWDTTPLETTPNERRS